MAYNSAGQIRLELLTHLCKMMFNGNIKEDIDKIPIVMRPKSKNISRCCIYNDRAVLKYRIMAMLGFNPSDETDELTTLSKYVELAEGGKQSNEGNILTVLDVACSSCIKSSYSVTNLCRTCFGQACIYSCRKGAITKVNNKVEIDHEKCVNCGMCMEACAFNAIVYQPVPCEQSCPVGAMSKDENGKEVIDPDKCIYCGRCKNSCPFGAVVEKTSLLNIIDDIKTGQNIIAMVAPAVMGQFNAPAEKLLGAIKELGFSDVIEVAKGANITSANEAAEFDEMIENNGDFMTTSCCFAYTSLIKKHIPALLPKVSHTRTPMSYTAELLKAEHAECKTVFVSPCVSKRHEGREDDNVDYVMSIEALYAMFQAKDLDISSAKEIALDPSIDASGRAFPYTGGVAESVIKYSKMPEKVNALVIDGINIPDVRMLKNLSKTIGNHNIVEVMMCKGGCVGGCDTIEVPRTATRKVKDLCKRTDV